MWTQTNTIRAGYYTQPFRIPGRLAAAALADANARALWSMQTCTQCGVAAAERDGSIFWDGTFECVECA